MRENNKPTAVELLNRCTMNSTVKTTPKTAPIQHPTYSPPKRLTSIQATIWMDIAATIKISKCDLFLLETCVCLVDQQRTLQIAVNKDGPIVMQSNGRPMHNPAATALRQIEPQLTRCFKEMGMSPATRSRLKLDCRTNLDYNEWAEF